LAADRDNDERLGNSLELGLYRSILRKGALDEQEADRCHCEREKMGRDY
jgi:hypothetical protein